ncbi:MAG TPA: hypothetical protein VKT77_08850, partial [Chthonomonadaceae bacterium]|nr:hypothetical protein [Chthonomonadaceae bacterium]
RGCRDSKGAGSEERAGAGGSADSTAARFVPIVTDLWRTTQPIIRYRMNDIVSLEPNECPCGSGFRVLSAVEGRCDDVFYFAALSGGIRPFFPDTIRRMALLASDAIQDYEAVQTQIGALRLHLATSPEAFDAAAGAVRRTVLETMARYGCAVPLLTIERGVPARPPGEKRRRVRRERAAG